MRKLLYILIGLVLVLIAVSLGGYRHVYEPRVRNATNTTRSIDRAVRPDATARAPQAARPSTSVPSTTTTTTTSTGLSTWATFDTVVNVLNVVVGVVGIVLALMGMRMQRAAMALQGTRDHR